jgi:hypothetical protein
MHPAMADKQPRRSAPTLLVSFGNRRLLAIVPPRPFLVCILGCGVAFGGSCLAFSPILPPAIAQVLLDFGLILHLTIAGVLGLNTFFWSFTATFPAILWTSMWLYNCV